MSEAENQLKICFETLNFLSSNVNTMSNILTAVVNHYGHQDPVAGKLAKEFNKGVTPMYTVCYSEKNARNIVQSLKESGVNCYKTYMDKGAGQEPDIIVVYSSSQKDLAEKVINRYYAENLHGQAVEKSIIHDGSKGPMHKVYNLSPEQCTLFEEYCRNNGINIACEGPEKGKYSIYYQQQDKRKMEIIARRIAVDLSGESGRYLSRRIRYANENFEKINMRILHTEKNDHFFVMDPEGHELEVTPSYVKYKSDVEENKLYRSNPEFKERVNFYLAGHMQGHVLLTPEQHKELQSIQGKTAADTARLRKEFLHQIEMQQGCPQVDEIIYQDFAAKERNLENYNKEFDERSGRKRDIFEIRHENRWNASFFAFADSHGFAESVDHTTGGKELQPEEAMELYESFESGPDEGYSVEQELHRMLDENVPEAEMDEQIHEMMEELSSDSQDPEMTHS